MFEGVHQDQFHQFLAAAASNSTPISSSSSTSHHHLLHQQQQQQQPTPLSFSLLHGCNPSSSPSPSLFHHDPYNNNNNPVQLHPHQHIIHQQQIQWAPPSDAHTKQQHHHQINAGVIKQERQGEAVSTHGGFLAMERQRSMAEEEQQQPDLIDSSVAVAWSHDELLALLRIRSALENWFPEFTWEHVSRKLSELGFKRSPQKCKERFEEESRSYFHAAKNSDVTSMENDVSCPTSKNNYRLFSELEELCHHRHDPPPPPPPPPQRLHHHHHHQQHHQQQQSMDVINPREDVNVNQGDAVLDKQNPQREEGRVEDDSEQEERVKSLDENNGSEAIDKADQQENIETQQRFKKDRMNKKKKKKFEIFKTFCEEIVSKMMSHQEDLHKKILQDMIKRDEEKIAREEAWKNQEMERINKEMEARARDLAMVSDRQAKIIEFLKKFASDSLTNNTMITSKKDANNEAPKSTHQNPSSSATHSSPNHLPTSSNEGSISQSSNPTKNRPNARKPRPNKRARSDNCSDGNDIGKRWPREEVLALISIRCNIDLASKTGPDDSGQNQNNSNSNSSNKNPPLWERISHKMVEMGYSRSAKRCKEKWENINKYFRKTKDMNKNRSVDSRTCPYFHQLNHLYNQGRAAEGGGGAEGGCGGGSGGGAMNVDISDQGEDASGVQVTLSAACDLEF